MMEELTIEAGERAGGSFSDPAVLDRLARRIVCRRLAALRYGRLELVEEGAREVFGDPDAPRERSACVRVHDPAFYSEIAFGGAVGAGEAFMLGYWSADDLTGAVRIMLQNRPVLEQMDTGTARLIQPMRRWLHWVNRNTRTGSRRNIAAHYDLGNEFFALWLDSRMMYSSALFDCPGMTLEAASVSKLDRICSRLRLTREDCVLEIGTGWGGFAIHAAQNYGCHVTTTTISRRQYEFACARVASLGLEDRITVLFDDYRDLHPERHGRFDKLVTIEMIEAVGHRYQPQFFRKCAEMLKPEGLMLLQSITIADQQYERVRRSVDFIQRHIFPGGCLTSVSAMLAMLTRETDLRAVNLEDFGPSYAETLAHWRERFFRRIEEVRALGYPETFLRMWHYYLSYCEGAFLERATGVVQILLMRPLNRHVTYDRCNRKAPPGRAQGALQRHLLDWPLPE
jgi:cyclopropane-fatty-acyl-phospholipid synthase